MKITDLLQMKLFLEKYAKMQNIEQYTMNYIHKYWKVYKDYLDKNKGIDIDFNGFKLDFK